MNAISQVNYLPVLIPEAVGFWPELVAKYLALHQQILEIFA
jgi:hypothetical protein